ncbi:hypothetical protein GW17_00058161, partial [Ensete ventricosum]
LYNRQIRPRSISDSDLILRKAEVSDLGHTRGKLAKVGRIVPSRLHHLRRDLHPNHDGLSGPPPDMAHFKLEEILCLER